jgi:DNA-directed RNA polymerase specialized sigma24 family protein
MVLNFCSEREPVIAHELYSNLRAISWTGSVSPAAVGWASLIQSRNRFLLRGNSMADDDSITQWIDGIRNGEDEAARRLWGAFFERLLVFARQRLKMANRAIHDEEDIVLSAFESFCAGVQRGRFPQLRDREDLWRLLFVITARKVADQFAFQNRVCRDVSRSVSQFDSDPFTNREYSELFLSQEPPPEFAAECADQLRHLLDQLQHDDLKHIAILKMEGYTNEEIAQQLARGLATVERKLRAIREIWSQAP